MKAAPETALFTVPHGSHLYGTNGPESDYDWKVVCLPTLDTLLLNNRVSNRKVKPDGLGSQGKMRPDDEEFEYIPLQIFLDDFFAGQTYAVEMAFAVLQGECTDHGHTPMGAYSLCEHLVDNFLTRNVDKMVGYAVSQSKMYGLKTERYTVLKNVVDLIGSSTLATQTIESNQPMIEQLCTLKYVSTVMIEASASGTVLVPALEVCGKKFPYTTKWASMYASLVKSLDTYGNRVKSFDGQGVDWKALAHAIRIIEQAIELSASKILTFPRPNANFLRMVKLGKIPIIEAMDYLTAKFNLLDEAVNLSALPLRSTQMEEDFVSWKIGALRATYGL